MATVTETLSREDKERNFENNAAGSSSPEGELLDLLGEVEHDVGNLMHRMYYWCEILEQAVRDDGSATEATVELRKSLGELYRLISRSSDLMRPVQVRTFRVALADVCRRILQRLGCGFEVDDRALAGFADFEVPVDPMPLDRALDMIAEVLDCAERGEASAVQARLRVDDGGRATPPCFYLDLCIREGGAGDLRSWSPGGAAERICGALAARILKSFGWELESRLNTPSPSCTITIPLRHSTSRRRTTGHA